MLKTLGFLKLCLWHDQKVKTLSFKRFINQFERFKNWNLLPEVSNFSRGEKSELVLSRKNQH